MKRMAVLAILVTGGILSASAQDNARPAQVPWTAVENYADRQFLDFRASGSIALSGTCNVALPGDSFVTEKIIPPDARLKDLGKALNFLALMNPHYSWARSQNGFVQLRDDRVNDNLLAVRLDYFVIWGDIGPDEAVNELMSAPEAKSFMRTNAIERGMTFTGSDFDNHWMGSPRNSVPLKNASVEETLNQIVTLYPRFWIYNECLGASMRRMTIRTVTTTCG